MNSSAGSKKKTLMNFLSLSILQIGNYVLPMITLPIISRIIGPEKYGAVNYAFAFVGYFIMLINAGFDLYGTRQIISFNGDKGKINELFSRITLSKVYISIVSTIIFVFCLFTIEQLRAEKLITIFTYLMCIGWIINPSWLYNGMQDSRRYAVFSFTSKLLFSVAVVLMVREKSDYIYHPLITSLAHILVSFISFVYAIRKYKIKLHIVHWKKVLGTINENKSLSIIWWITNQASSTGIVVAGFLLSGLEIGYYSAALRMIIIIQSIVSMPLNTVLFPYIGEAFVKGYSNGIERVHKTLPYLFMIAVVIATGTFVISKPLILLFFGVQFAEAAFLLKILAVALFFSTINNALGQQIMLNLKRDGIQIKFITSGFILNVLFLLLFINSYGITGAALAWPAAEMLMFIGYMIYFKLNSIQVINAAYYNPRLILANTFKMIRFNPLKAKGALR
jgi:O-antigen/teichoic acid export membrane protein